MTTHALLGFSEAQFLTKIRQGFFGLQATEVYSGEMKEEPKFGQGTTWKIEGL